jgi:hypothetical protein
MANRFLKVFISEQKFIFDASSMRLRGGNKTAEGKLAPHISADAILNIADSAALQPAIAVLG